MQWCPLDDIDGTSSSSCSETSRTGRELIDHDSNAEGGTGSTVDPAPDEGACAVVSGGGKKAAIDSLVAVPITEVRSSSGWKKPGSGPKTTTRNSTISFNESGAIDESRGHASPRLLSSNNYSATNQCGCGKILEASRVISIARETSQHVRSSELEKYKTNADYDETHTFRLNSGL